MASDGKDQYELKYFPGRGLGEIVRLVFAQAGVEYTDTRIAFDAWSEFKPQTPWGQMPILYENGKALAQSGAIVRYLSSKFGLAGANAFEAALIDAVSEALKDSMKNYFTARSVKDEKEKAEKLAEYFSKDWPTFAARFEANLKANNEGAGYFVGDKVSHADLAVYYTTWVFLQDDAKVLDAFPLLKAHHERIAALPNIAAWVAKRPASDF